jgi:hypothetical protein
VVCAEGDYSAEASKHVDLRHKERRLLSEALKPVDLRHKYKIRVGIE